MNTDDLKVIISDDILQTMDQRGIKENEVKDVIGYSLNGEIYLHTSDKGQVLAKKKLGNFTVYVEYTVGDDTYKVANVYSHRVSLLEDQEKEE